MQKVAEQLQLSLVRHMTMSPPVAASGQIRVLFGINADGSLSHCRIADSAGVDKEMERIFGEEVVRNAAPFEPLTPEMQQDDNFQKMTVIVHLM